MHGILFRGVLYGFHRGTSRASFWYLFVMISPRTWQQPASFIDSLANPPQMKRKPPMKNGSQVEIIYVWRYNDVIRKKIISSLPEKNQNWSVFAFSSWLYLILILWLFSDHIQMGIRREESQHEGGKNGANTFEIIHDDIRSDALEEVMSTQQRYVLSSPSSTEIVIDMHRNWKIINFVCVFFAFSLPIDLPYLHRRRVFSCWFSSLSNLWVHFSFNLFWIRESRSKVVDKPINEFIFVRPSEPIWACLRRFSEDCSKHSGLGWNVCHVSMARFISLLRLGLKCFFGFLR